MTTAQIGKRLSARITAARKVSVLRLVSLASLALIFFVTTKVPGCGVQGTSRENCGSDSLKAAADNLIELGLDYVDLLLVHFPPVGGCKNSFR
jgi:aryl-alcohol dehydrogenase-like predicted oxidoreductase